MKKLFLVLAIIAFGSSVSADTKAQEYCPKEPYNIDSGIASIVSTITGTNFVTSKILENRLEAALNKELNANFKVELDTFGGNNLLGGKFKSLKATTKSAESNGIYFSDIEAVTLCEFNHLKYENEKLYFVEPTVVKYNGKITENDLKKTIMSNEYVSALSNISVTSSGKTIAKVSDLNIKIQNNRVVMSYDVSAPMIFGDADYTVSFSAGLEIEEGKIKLCDVDFGNPLTNLTMRPFLPTINKLNPFVYKVKVAKNYNSTVSVKTVKIINNEIYIDGVVVIPRNDEAQGGEYGKQ